MQTPNEDGKFYEETETFNLTVSLNGDRLTLILKDFVDWVIYQKQYTEEDVGGEIHKKMDLFDIYTSFCQTKINSDNSSMKQNQSGITRLKQYEFGSVVENEGNPCYKIDREGVVTVYCGLIDKKTKKETTYQSILTLKKVRDMTKMEILSQRSDIIKKNILDELSRKINKQEQQKQALLTKISQLEEENMNLKIELRLTQQAQHEKNQRFQQKITQLTYANQRLQQKLTNTNQQLQARLVQKIQAESQHNQNKFAQLDTILAPIKEAQNLHTLPQLYRPYFAIDGLKVQFIGTEWLQYIFNKPINANQSAKFKIKILRSQRKQMTTGVVDHAKQKNSKYSYSSGNSMCYYAINSQKNPGGGIEGDGFKQGDIVEVEINRASSTVKYIVNGELEATHTHQMLADASRVFYAFVQMRDKDDAIEWLMY